MIKVAVAYSEVSARPRVDAVVSRISDKCITSVLAPYGEVEENLKQLGFIPSRSSAIKPDQTERNRWISQRLSALSRAGSQVLLVVGAGLASPKDTLVDVGLARILQEDTRDSDYPLYEEICVDDPEAGGLTEGSLAPYGAIRLASSRLLGQAVDIGSLFEPILSPSLNGPEAGVQIPPPLQEPLVKPRYT